MRKLLLLCVILLAVGGSAFAQGVRFSSTVTQQGTIGAATNAVVLPSSPAIAFCTHPANAVPCTNKAITYTDQTLATPCLTSTQIVRDGTNTCVASPDSQNNWGVWVAPNSVGYDYTITLAGGVNLGPFNVLSQTTTINVPVTIASPGSLTVSGTGTAGLWNGVCIVDGVKNATLAAAVTCAGTSGVIEIPMFAVPPLTANVTIPAGVTLRFDGPSGITTTGFTLTINGPISAPPGVQLFFGNGTVTLSATATTEAVEAEWFPGATCGDKINAAFAALSAPGSIVEFDNSCGLGTAGSPWAAVAIPANMALRADEPGVYWTRNILLNSVSQLYSSIPCGPGLINLTCPVTLEQGNGLNLTSHITVALGSNQASISDINMHGNKANNPIGGVELLVQGQGFSCNRSITQNSPSHGTMYSSTGVNNQAAAPVNNNCWYAINNGDGKFALNTADGREYSPSYENNGITATVNTTATTLTQTAGSTWSTDSSLVGTHFHLGTGTTWYDCIVGAIPSTTTITLGTCISVAPTPGTVTAIGTNSGWTIYWGSGDEYSNSPTWREVNHDHGANQTAGHLVYASTGSVESSVFQLVGTGQFGNGINCDIEYVGDGTLNGSLNLAGGTFANIEFVASGLRTPNSVWSHLCLLDGGGMNFSGLTFSAGNSPHTLAHVATIGETIAGNYTFSKIEGTYNPQFTAYSSTLFNDVTKNGTAINVGGSSYITAGSINQATQQTATVGATNLYAIPSNFPCTAVTGTCRFTLTYMATVKQAATTSSTLGPVNLICTDNDTGVVVTITGTINTGNTTGTAIGGTLSCNAQNGTTIQYSVGYTSVGATPMGYVYHLALSQQ